MHLDLTPFFVSAAERAAEWSPERFEDTLHLIVALLNANGVEQVDLNIDWNKTSGERWGRVLHEQYVVAIDRYDLPLVILQEYYSGMLKKEMETRGIVVASVEGFENKLYRLDPSIVGRVVPGWEWRGEAIDPQRLSVIELWWASI